MGIHIRVVIYCIGLNISFCRSAVSDASVIFNHVGAAISFEISLRMIEPAMA